MSDQPQVRQEVAAGRDAHVAGRDIINYFGSAGPVVPGLLPRDVPGFAGRDGELARLAALAGRGRVVVLVISGTAGVGKTALAVHAAHQLLGQFPDGHLYADLRGYTEGQDPAEPGEVLQVFLRRLGVQAEEIPADVEEQSGLLRQLLAGRRVLMVLDNARTEAQIRPLVPGVGGSLVLVTSRSVLPGLEADERISLGILTEGEAVVMLARVIGTRAGTAPEAVAEVARLCGRLPLALRIAGQLLAAHPAWPVNRLAQMLAEEQDRLARLGAGDLQVRAAFGVSYAQLAEEDARLFRLLGLHPGPDFDAGSAAALAGIGGHVAGLVLDRLAGTHLVTEDTMGRYSMHDLLRLFARATCQDTDSQADRDAAETRLISHYADLAEYLDSCVDPRLRPAAEQTGASLISMRQAVAVFQAERPGLLAALGLAVQRGWYAEVRQLGDHMSVPLTILRYLDDMLTAQNHMLAVARQTGDRATEGRIFVNLGIAYAELRRFAEALDCFQRSLTIARETGDRHSQGYALNNLGIAYGELRRFEEAVDCLQPSLEISRETGDRYGEGQALNNLGIAYRELQQFEEAVDCHQQVLTMRREDGNQRGEGLALNGLGITYTKLRQFEKAIDCHQQALAIFQETGDRHSEGMTLNNLGAAYAELRQFDEAIDCYQKDAAICAETGDRHGEAQSLDSVGVVYQQRRQFHEAIDCHQQALAIFQETGDRHSEGQALTNLGTAHAELLQPGQAVECWREAAAAMHDASDHEQAERLEQLASGTQSKPRRRWGLRRGPSS